jgi:hypothetical protein
MSNQANINEYCDNADIQGLHALEFLGHTNSNGNAPSFATNQDAEMLTHVKSASFEFKPTLSNGAVINSSVYVVSDITTLSTLTPTTTKSLIPASTGTSIDYNTSCGIFAVQVTNAVASGANDNLKLVDWCDVLRNSEYSLMIKYFNDMAGANIAIGFDVTDMPLLGSDTEVAFQFIGDQEVLTAINGKYVLQGNGSFEIVDVDEGTSIVRSNINMTLYKIKVQA